MSAPVRSLLVGFTVLLALVFGPGVLAQTAAEMAALENRLMARLEQRMAEEGEATRADQEAQRLAFEQAVRAMARSDNALDRRALAAIDQGRTGQGLDVLEERARASDAQVLASGDATARQRRADEWKRIGALAFLDNTARAVEAYENALRFVPDDAETLDQLAYLYARQARRAEQARVAQQLADHSDQEWKARGLIHLGDVRLEAGEARAGRQHYESAIEAARQAGSVREETRATTRLAAAYMLAGNNREFEASIEQALALSRANGLRWEEAEALYARGTAHFMRGRSSLMGRQRHFAEAEPYFAQAHAIARELNDEIGAAQVAVRRGHAAHLMNDNTRAEGMLREAIATFDRRGVRQRLGFAQHQLANVLVAQGRMGEARPLFQSSVDLAREANLAMYEGSALMEWGQAEANSQNNAEACRITREAQAAFVRAGDAEGAGAFRTMTGISANLYCSAARRSR